MDEEVKDTVEETSQTEETAVSASEESQESLHEPIEGKPSNGILDKISNIFKRSSSETGSEELVQGEAEVGEESSEAEEKGDGFENKDTGDESSLDTYVEVDPGFVEAASAYGWTEQQIRDAAETHTPKEIVELTSSMRQALSEANVSGEEESTKKEDGIDWNALSELATKDENVGKIVHALKATQDQMERVTGELDAIKKGSEETTREREVKEAQEILSFTNETLDMLASDYPEVGVDKDLPRYPDGRYVETSPQFLVRNGIFQRAEALKPLHGGDFKSAMEDAVRWYKGGNEAKTEAKVIKKLKDAEQGVMPKRRDSKVTKNYQNEQERKADLVNSALAKYGVELPQ